MDPPWLAALADPAAFGAPPGTPVERVETHISWVFLVGSEVWKIKKPVDLGFLDFTTLEARRAACEAEVVLNRRLAPGVYLGVREVRAAVDSVKVGGTEGELVDHAVHMQRMPVGRRADILLRAGKLGFDEVARIATRLAAFHAAARGDAETARYGLPETIARNVAENIAQTALAAVLSPEEARGVVAEQTRFLADHDALLRARAAAGRSRDGHGDLRLEHLYLRDEDVIALDCIEFNDRFRYGDVAADLAFLAMDLTAAGRADLAEHLLAVYAREADDYDLYAVVDFYEAYRAWVRGKVATLVAAGADERGLRTALADARRYLLVALGADRPRALPPRVVGVAGPVAAGKSTVAAALARHLGAPVVDADRTRKAMLGVGPTDRLDAGAFQGAYDPRVTERVYAEVLRRAAVVLASGRPVVLDASFRSRALRAEAAALAARFGVPFGLVVCDAPRAVLEARLHARERDPGRVSDAGVAVLDRFLAAWEPVGDEGFAWLPLRTDRAWDEVRAEAERWVPGWPARLTG